ncbi:MAG: hypothetical protein L3J74_12280 [Bacteroidales bacterium]|nr:hypothetical protein [Bacteroidales bacterium]
MSNIRIFLKRIWAFIDGVNKHKALSFYEWEEKELRNTFAVLIAGSFAGIPAPPAHISLALLPYIENDLEIMFERLDAVSDPIGELFSVYDIG